MIGGVNKKQVCERSEVKSQRRVWGANVDPDISTQSGHIWNKYYYPNFFYGVL